MPMADLGALLYVISLVLLVLIYRRLPARSLEALLEAGRREHHAVQRVVRRHPCGGRARQMMQWLRQEAD